MNKEKQILYITGEREGSASAAARRPLAASLVRRLLTEASDDGRLLGTQTVFCEDFLASDGEAPALLSAVREKGIGALFYTAAADCLGNGEALLRDLQFARKDTGGRAPHQAILPLPAPAVLPQLLCHLGISSVILEEEKAAEGHPVCCENALLPPDAAGFCWQTPDGSECLVRRPTALSPRSEGLGLRHLMFSPDETLMSCYTGALASAALPAPTEQSVRDSHALDLVLGRLEPLCALLAAVGRIPYPAVTLERLTRSLLKNLALTDGIVAPTVADHRRDRTQTVCEEGEALLRASLATALPHSLPQGAVATLTAFSPFSRVGHAMLSFSLTLPAETPIALRDASGKELAYTVTSQELLQEGQVRYTLLLSVPAFPPLSVQHFFVFSQHTGRSLLPKKLSAPRIENRFFVCDATDGRLTVICKKSGRVWHNPFFFEDQGDRGSNAFLPAQEGSLICYPASFAAEECGLIRVLHAACDFELPCCYDAARHERACETRPVRCRLTLSLSEEDEHLEVAFCVEDAVEDHRLRLAVRTELNVSRVLCDTPFDYAVSAAAHFPHAAFLALEEKGRRLAVLTDAPRAAERVNDTLYFVLAHRALYLADAPAVTEGRFALLVDRPLSPADLFIRARRFRVGYPCVVNESPSVAETPEKPALSHPFLSWDAPDVVLTGCRYKENGRAAVCHLLNLAGEKTVVRLSSPARLSLGTLAEQEEIPLAEDGTAALTLAPRQIVAVLLRFS